MVVLLAHIRTKRNAGRFPGREKGLELLVFILLCCSNFHGDILAYGHRIVIPVLDPKKSVDNLVVSLYYVLNTVIRAITILSLGGIYGISVYER
jgi:hypothetical protein